MVQLHLFNRVLLTVCKMSRSQYSTAINESTFKSSPFQEVIEDTTAEDKVKSLEIITKVNNHIADDPGRLFAIIYILGKQYKVTIEDLILIERYWAPEMRDKLSFEKVMLVGGSSFTLIGRPILPKNLVTVTGTIVQKDFTQTKIRFRYRKKERNQSLNFLREELTFIRINKIEIYPKINELSECGYIERA